MAFQAEDVWSFFERTQVVYGTLLLVVAGFGWLHRRLKSKIVGELNASEGRVLAAIGECSGALGRMEPRLEALSRIEGHLASKGGEPNTIPWPSVPVAMASDRTEIRREIDAALAEKVQELSRQGGVGGAPKE